MENNAFCVCTSPEPDGRHHQHFEHDPETGECKVEGCDCKSFYHDEDAVY